MPIMTWSKLYDQIKAGWGQGHGEGYQPWIPIHRKNTSKESNQKIGRLPGRFRSSHDLSLGENNIELALRWLKVLDQREQFPIWFKNHPHPLIGAPNTEHIKFPQVAGSLEIAKQAGIRHPKFFGTNIPYVPTIDILVTVDTKRPYGTLVGIAGKASEIIEESEDGDRMRDLLEIQRRYLELIGYDLLIRDGKQLPVTFIGNLNVLRSAFDIPHGFSANQIQDYSDSFKEFSIDNSLIDTVRRSTTLFRCSFEQSLYVFHHCCWHGYIDIDISKRLIMSYPRNPGGDIFRRKVWQYLLGTGRLS